MASIAERLIGGAQQAATQVGQDVGAGLTQLGNRIERTQQQRQKLDAQKAQIRQKKVGRFAEAVISGSKLKDAGARNSFFKNFLPQLSDALDVGDVFNPETLKMVASSPELQASFQVMISRVQRGQITFEEAAATFNDPLAFTEFSGEAGLKAERFALTTEATVAAAQAKATAGVRKEKVAATQRVFKNTGDLRKELRRDPVTKDTIKINAALDKVESALGGKDPSAPGDMSAIFAFMKILDPGSTVREGEFASAQNTAGIPDRILNLYNRAAKGTLLNPTQRKQFLSVARSIQEGQLKRQESVNSRFEDLAVQSGLDPKQVIIGKRLPKPSTPKPASRAEQFAGFSQAKKEKLAAARNMTVEELAAKLGAK